MTYFKNCRTAEEAKELYRQLAKKLHPDCGGNAEEFKKMSTEFTAVFEDLKNRHTTADGQTYTKESAETAAEYMEIINKVIHMTDCTVELIGSWIWISGNTYPHREELKKVGFRFGSKKKAWYFHFGEYKKHGKNENSLSDLRQKWGSVSFETHAQYALN